MPKLITRVAGRALDVALFGVGLVEGTIRGVASRLRGPSEAAAPSEPAASQPPDLPRPTVPERPTPDPYDVDVTTPVGTTGAGVGYNPDTAESDLQQPGTEPLMDPSTTKRIKAETDALRKAADPDKG